MSVLCKLHYIIFGRSLPRVNAITKQKMEKWKKRAKHNNQQQRRSMQSLQTQKSSWINKYSTFFGSCAKSSRWDFHIWKNRTSWFRSYRLWINWNVAMCIYGGAPMGLSWISWCCCDYSLSSSHARLFCLILLIFIIMPFQNASKEETVQKEMKKVTSFSFYP